MNKMPAFRQQVYILNIRLSKQIVFFSDNVDSNGKRGSKVIASFTVYCTHTNIINMTQI